jgi:hypothetical protein
MTFIKNVDVVTLTRHVVWAEDQILQMPRGVSDGIAVNNPTAA